MKKSAQGAREAKTCGQCGRTQEEGEKFLVCGRCKVLAYCSKACQKQHWRGGHKVTCQAGLTILFRNCRQNRLVFFAHLQKSSHRTASLQHGGRGREVTVGSLFHLKSPAGDFSEWPVGDRRPGDRRPGHLGVTGGGGAPGGGSSRGDPEVTWGVVAGM